MDDQPHRSATGAAFITKDHLLLALKESGEDSRPMIEIFSLKPRTYLCRCLLPFPDAIDGIWTINNQNFSNPTNPFASISREFIPDPDLNIIGLKLEWETGSRTASAVVVISIKSLLDICSCSLPNQVLQWEAWGPQSTRWLFNDLREAGDICIFGSRMVVWETSQPSTGRRLALLDFNPRNLQREKLLRGIEHVYDSPSEYTCDLEGALPLQVTSSLPFRKLVVGRSPYSDVDLDGMNLICHEVRT